MGWRSQAREGVRTRAFRCSSIGKTDGPSALPAAGGQGSRPLARSPYANRTREQAGISSAGCRNEEQSLTLKVEPRIPKMSKRQKAKATGTRGWLQQFTFGWERTVTEHLGQWPSRSDSAEFREFPEVVRGASSMWGSAVSMLTVHYPYSGKP
jgi:hypothetical protein